MTLAEKPAFAPFFCTTPPTTVHLAPALSTMGMVDPGTDAPNSATLATKLTSAATTIFAFT